MEQSYDLKTLLYKVPPLADWLHGFPHVNFGFEEVDSLFDPSNPDYVESLLVIGASLLLWLALWIVVFLVYFVCSCIRSRRGLNKSADNTKCIRWATVIMTLLVLTSIIVAFYGNEKAHIGVEKAAQSLSEFSDDTGNLYAQSFHVGSLLNDSSNYSTVLREIWDTVTGTANQELVRELGLQRNHSYGTVTRVIPGMVSCLTLTAGALGTGPSLMGETQNYEQYRWMITLGVSVWQVLTCLLLWCSIGMKSRRMLLVCLFLAFLNLAMIWFISGAYTSLSVGGGDFCINPDRAVSSELFRINSKCEPHYADQAAVIDYYLKCAADDKSVYFTALNELQNALIFSNSTLQTLKTGAAASMVEKVELAQAELTVLFTGFLKLVALADCTAAHKSYVEAVSNVCHNSLLGLVYLAFSYMAAGLFMIASIFFIHSASRDAEFSHAYYDGDSQEPFLPRGQQPPARNDNQLYYRFSTGDGPGEAAPAIPHGGDTHHQPPQRNTPPPAYNTGEFYSTYGNSETLDSRRDHMELRTQRIAGSHPSGTMESSQA